MSGGAKDPHPPAAGSDHRVTEREASAGNSGAENLGPAYSDRLASFLRRHGNNNLLFVGYKCSAMKRM